jgi:phage replication-related protein YjqB (UPF0714/DUF867 family)
MPEGPDVYTSMTALYKQETEGTNYTKQWYRHAWQYQTFKNFKRENEVFIMAPHGGGIESGTTELALATAGYTEGFNGQPATSATYDFFIFNGINAKYQNGRLHVTSSHYNDATAIELVKNSRISLAFHGCTDQQAAKAAGKALKKGEAYSACLIGGLDEDFLTLLETRLQGANFNAFITHSEMLNGDLPQNIINRNKRNKGGAQLEITTTFRRSLYTIHNRTKRRTTTKPEFWLFVNTVRETIEQYRQMLL